MINFPPNPTESEQYTDVSTGTVYQYAGSPAGYWVVIGKAPEIEIPGAGIVAWATIDSSGTLLNSGGFVAAATRQSAGTYRFTFLPEVQAAISGSPVAYTVVIGSQLDYSAGTNNPYDTGYNVRTAYVATRTATYVDIVTFYTYNVVHSRGGGDDGKDDADSYQRWYSGNQDQPLSFVVLGSRPTP